MKKISVDEMRMLRIEFNAKYHAAMGQFEESRHALQSEILALCNAYQSKHGIGIESINIDTFKYRPFEGHERLSHIDVRVELERI